MNESSHLFQQQKGNSSQLSGNMIAYALIEDNTDNSDNSHISKNGIMAVGGDFRRLHNLKDFLKEEFKDRLEEGLEQLFSQLQEKSDLPDDFSPSGIEEKLDSIEHMEIIPVPAKVLLFDSVEELLQENADIYFMGSFKQTQNAHLCITSFPIFYQSRYREQTHQDIHLEINQLLETLPEDTISIPTPPAWLSYSFSDIEENLFQTLQNEIIPDLSNSQNNSAQAEQYSSALRTILSSYKHQDDVESLIICSLENKTALALLYAQKINALHHECFEALSQIQKQIIASS